MSPRQTQLPTTVDVYAAIRAVSEATGRPATAFAVARRLAIPNTTFRRNFPGIVSELKRRERSADPSMDGASEAAFHRLKKDNARLRSELRDWKDNCELAIANIQRLALEIHDLREELEALTGTASIDKYRSSGQTR